MSFGPKIIALNIANWKEDVHKFKERKPIQSTSYTSLPKLTVPANFIYKLFLMNENLLEGENLMYMKSVQEEQPAYWGWN